MDADVADGVTTADAIAQLDALAEEVLPAGVQIAFLGEAAELQRTNREIAITFAIAVLVVLLVLAAQFESFLSALVVVLTVPFGLAAAVFSLWLTGTSLNVYSQIGLVLAGRADGQERHPDRRIRRPDARPRREAPGAPCSMPRKERLRPVIDDHAVDRAGRAAADPGQRGRGRGPRRDRLGDLRRPGDRHGLHPDPDTGVLQPAGAARQGPRAHHGARLADEMRESEAVADFPVSRAAE